MAITFDTTEYRFSHGHEPRGRGSWAFEIPLRGQFWTPGSTTYREAKQLAARATREILAAAGAPGAPARVKVLP